MFNTENEITYSFGVHSATQQILIEGLQIKHRSHSFLGGLNKLHCGTGQICSYNAVKQALGTGYPQNGKGSMGEKAICLWTQKRWCGGAVFELGLEDYL